MWKPIILAIHLIISFTTFLFVSAQGYYGQEKCDKLVWNTVSVPKGSGSVVMALESVNQDAVGGFNWYDAASCCKYKGKMLSSISNRGDLDGYFTLRSGKDYVGWSNVHGYESRWKNLYGEYIELSQRNLFFESINHDPHPPVRGRCRQIEHEGVAGARTFTIYNLDCNEVWTQVFYCEDLDPKQPPFNVDCHNLRPNLWWSKEDWEVVLDSSHDCPPPDHSYVPSPPLPTYPGSSRNVYAFFYV